jgi:hypothetical protein
MCDCQELKECCGCLKGGCDCICECACHTGDANDPCYAFPTLNCPECAAKREENKKRAEEDMKEYGRVPTDEEIASVFRGKPIL